MSDQESDEYIPKLHPLEIIVLCKRQLRPQRWKLKSGPSSTSIFPSIPYSMQQLESSERVFLIAPFQDIEMKILRKRRMLPYSHPEFYHFVSGSTMPHTGKKIENRGIWRCEVLTAKYWSYPEYLDILLRGAKNLQSLIFSPVSDFLNFKCIRKARNLQNLLLSVNTSQIMQYPQLFKRLNALQKVKIEVIWTKKNERRTIGKFFGYLLGLPKLQHLTVWLDKGGDYYKTLLFEIDKRKLASFYIVVQNEWPPLEGAPEYPKDWGKCIDTLVIGPFYWLGEEVSVSQNPEKRLKLGRGSNIDDLIGRTSAIKNLELIDLFTDLDASLETTLLELISQTKTLENLTLFLRETFPNSNEVYEKFNKKLSEMESLEKLQIFTFSLAHDSKETLQKITPPYNSKMKNLKTLSLKIAGYHFDFSSFTQALRDLLALENFSFKCKGQGRGSLPTNFAIDCDFHFEKLQNLKSISLDCDVPFSRSSMTKLVENIPQVENLESLKIEGEIFYGLERKKASGFIGDLCLQKNLKVAYFHWKEIENPRWTGVDLVRLKGFIVVSTGRVKLDEKC